METDSDNDTGGLCEHSGDVVRGTSVDMGSHRWKPSFEFYGPCRT